MYYETVTPEESSFYKLFKPDHIEFIIDPIRDLESKPTFINSFSLSNINHKVIFNMSN